VIYVRKNAFGIKKSINYNDLPMPDQDLQYWSNVFNKCLKPNAVIRNRIEREMANFPKGKKLLGVSIRAEYRWGGLSKHPLYYQHPKVASCDEWIDQIEKILDDWKYDIFFLACDDREYSDRICGYFGNKCIRMERRLLKLFENDQVVPLEDTSIEFKDYSIQKKTEDYITETYILSRCDSLFTCIGSGVQFAYIVNGGKYEHIKVHNLGLWTKEELA